MCVVALGWVRLPFGGVCAVLSGCVVFFWGLLVCVCVCHTLPHAALARLCPCVCRVGCVCSARPWSSKRGSAFLFAAACELLNGHDWERAVGRIHDMYPTSGRKWGGSLKIYFASPPSPKQSVSGPLSGVYVRFFCWGGGGGEMQLDTRACRSYIFSSPQPKS